MPRSYESPRWKTFSEIRALLEDKPSPVILLEGTRRLPDWDRPRLISLAKLLATQLPRALFRTGNASGSDEAFAEGIAAVDPRRLQYMLPYRTLRRERIDRSSYAVSMEDVSLAAEASLAQSTVSASPYIRPIVDRYRKNRSNPGRDIIAAYLMRDTLKVTGCSERNLAPADVGIFYVNVETPLSGGTGHTIRVCLEQNVPVITQRHWKEWLNCS